ncbi:MAG: hypothetical protein HYV32_00500 [Candidatus Kerfeldbacteria bacterium]|nr:hypothetical protein [Candidatus Kerfeldbacteria bacterium]
MNEYTHPVVKKLQNESYTPQQEYCVTRALRTVFAPELRRYTIQHIPKYDSLKGQSLESIDQKKFADIDFEIAIEIQTNAKMKELLWRLLETQMSAPTDVAIKSEVELFAEYMYRQSDATKQNEVIQAFPEYKEHIISEYMRRSALHNAQTMREQKRSIVFH